MSDEEKIGKIRALDLMIGNGEHRIKHNEDLLQWSRWAKKQLARLFPDEVNIGDQLEACVNKENKVTGLVVPKSRPGLARSMSSIKLDITGAIDFLKEKRRKIIEEN